MVISATDTQPTRVVGIFGGTFDPVHNAHLQMAIEAKQALRLDEVRMIPCHRPPHRGAPSLSSEQRLALLSMATKCIEGLVVDDRELKHDAPSYTVDTLISLRQELGNNVSLVFMMGMDAYASLDQWYQWSRLRELAHIAVMSRPGSAAPDKPDLSQALLESDCAEIVHQQHAGGLVVLNQSLLPVSATAIRQQLMQGQQPNNVPAEIIDYLMKAYRANDVENLND